MSLRSPLLRGWEQLEPEYLRVWEDYVGRLDERGILDERTRLLVLLGACVCLGQAEALDDVVNLALDADGVAPAEVLEVLLQAGIYVGKFAVDRAMEVFLRALGSRPAAAAQLAQSRPGRPANGRQRKLAIEGHGDPDWSACSPEVQRLAAKHGGAGISVGLRVTPTQHEPWITRLDRIDADFLSAWLDFVFVGMYARGVLDDGTRTLVMVGNCVAIGELEQATNHMRNALILGVPRRSVLEVLLLSTPYVGMPLPLTAVRILDELEEPPDRDAASETARHAKGGGS